MPIGTLLNVIGIVSAVIYSGSVMGASYMPSYAMISAGVFLVGVFYPFLREHGELSRGFQSIEEEFAENTARTLRGGDDVEVFSDEARPSIWRKRRPSSFFGVLILCAGYGLLGYDVFTYVLTVAPQILSDPGTISNF